MSGPEDEPQLPLTRLKVVLVATGIALWAAECVAAYVVAPATTGAGDVDGGQLALMWCISIGLSTVATLLIVRQADLPDVATAAFLVTISSFAVYTTSAALDVRNTPEEVNLVDTMFLGITSGALSALIVWGIAMGIARVLRMPTTAHLRNGGGKP